MEAVTAVEHRRPHQRNCVAEACPSDWRVGRRACEIDAAIGDSPADSIFFIFNARYSASLIRLDCRV